MDKTLSEPIVVIYTTAPPGESENLARELLDRHIVACINIFPVRSLYHWKGEACDEAEHLLVMKTTRAKAEDVIRAIQELHSNEVPEAVVLPVTAGYLPYLDWVREQVR